MITIEDFAKVEIKIGKVIEAKRVEGSNKLIVMKVDTGEERQIVAGIGKAYSPEELVGKSIVVVTNLQPAKLMGVESEPTGIRSNSIASAISTRMTCSLWLDPEYVQYRERVHSFAFAPCTFCGGCELLESNEGDCIGNEFPSCGGCLWAQGLIQCP